MVFPKTISSSTLPPAPTVRQPDFWLEENKEITEKLYAKQQKEKKKAGTKQAVQGYDSCSCVSWVRFRLAQETGIVLGSITYAKNLKIQGQIPIVGAIVITTEGYYTKEGVWTGHIGFVEAKEGDIITVSDGNFGKCGISKRQLNINDPIIRGYYYGKG